MKLMDKREVLKSRSLMLYYHIMSFCIITLIFLTTISTHMCFFIYYVLSHISGVHGPSLDLFSFIASIASIASIGRSSDKMGWPSLSCDKRRMDRLSRCSRSIEEFEMVMKWFEFFRRCPPSHNCCLCCLDVLLTLKWDMNLNRHDETWKAHKLCLNSAGFSRFLSTGHSENHLWKKKKTLTWKGELGVFHVLVIGLHGFSVMRNLLGETCWASDVRSWTSCVCTVMCNCLASLHRNSMTATRRKTRFVHVGFRCVSMVVGSFRCTETGGIVDMKKIGQAVRCDLLFSYIYSIFAYHCQVVFKK